MKVFSLVLILALLVSGCAPFLPADELPTRQPVEPMLTPILVDTLVPSPTSTVTAVPLPTVGPDGEVLTIEQKEHLYQASLKYLAPGDGDAVNVALALKFVRGADVSNMCGPLAIAILRDAGLAPTDVDLHDFWLLNPRQKQSRAVLERVFPTSEYVDYPIDQPINEFDFKKFPLKTGDFLYIYAGTRGSFEHMLTVTRVDETGQPYTVTNLHTDSYHFAIREVVLYDPAQPGVGQFYVWTDKKNYELGLTGYGGFEIWRRVVPLSKVSQ